MTTDRETFVLVSCVNTIDIDGKPCRSLMVANEDGILLCPGEMPEGYTPNMDIGIEQAIEWGEWAVGLERFTMFVSRADRTLKFAVNVQDEKAPKGETAPHVLHPVEFQIHIAKRRVSIHSMALALKDIAYTLYPEWGGDTTTASPFLIDPRRVVTRLPNAHENN